MSSTGSFRKAEEERARELERRRKRRRLTSDWMHAITRFPWYDTITRADVLEVTMANESPRGAEHCFC